MISESWNLESIIISTRWGERCGFWSAWGEKYARKNINEHDSGAPRAKRACEAPWLNKSTHPRKFGNYVTDRSSDLPSAPQAYQCLLSHFLATLGAQEKADCSSMLSSIDSCQNRVSADQYHLTVSRAQCRPIKVEYFLKLSADNLLVFKWSQAHVYFFFLIHIKYVVFMSVSSRTIKILISNWPQTQKFSHFFFKYMRGRSFLTMFTCWSRSTSNFYALIG